MKGQREKEISAYRLQWLAVRVVGARRGVGLTARDRAAIGRLCGAGARFPPHFESEGGLAGLWVMPLTCRRVWSVEDVRRVLCFERPKLLSRGKEFAFSIFTDAQWGRGYGLTKKQQLATVYHATANR